MNNKKADKQTPAATNQSEKERARESERARERENTEKEEKHKTLLAH